MTEPLTLTVSEAERRAQGFADRMLEVIGRFNAKFSHSHAKPLRSNEETREALVVLNRRMIAEHFVIVPDERP